MKRKCEDFKYNEIYLFKKNNESIFIAKVISEDSNYFRTVDINVLKGEWSKNSELTRGFDTKSIKNFETEKINSEDYPEYFI